MDWWLISAQPSGCWAPCTWRCSSTRTSTEFWKQISRNASARRDRARLQGRHSASALSISGMVSAGLFNPEPAATVASHLLAVGSGLNDDPSRAVLESLGQRGCQGIHFFRVHDLIVALKEPSDGRLVNFHLCVADADGAVADNAVALLRLVRDLAAFDAGRWHGVQINGHAKV